MPYRSISGTVPQYSISASGTSADGYWLKFYAAGTTTPINMGADTTPTATLAKCTLNTRGEPISNSADPATVFIPHIDQNYKIVLYANEADADANTTASAVWVVDNLTNNFLTPTDIDSYANLRLINTASFTDGMSINITDDGIAGNFILRNSVAHGLTDNNGTIIVIDADWYAERIYEGPYLDPKWFGALIDGSTDDTAIIQACIAIGPTLVQGGTAATDGTLEVGFDQWLAVGADSGLIKLSANTASTAPVVWLNGNNAVFLGFGISKTQIKSENRCPEGVVKIGHENMTVSPNNVNYTHCSNMRIFGPVDGGQTTGDPDVCIWRVNPSIGTNVDSYFCTLTNLRANSANYAFRWTGDANGDHVYNIFGQNIGNATLSDHRAMFKIEGAADISGSTAFFHQSSGSTMIVIEDYDNTANPGGKNHNSPSANSLIGMVGEQGGAGAWLQALDADCSGVRNIIEGIDNGGGSILFEENFILNNTINNGDGAWQRRRLLINGGTGETNSGLTIQSDRPFTKMIDRDAAADNQKFEFFLDGGDLKIRVLNDSESSAADALSIARTGASVDTVDIMTGGGGNVVGRFDTSSSAGDMRLMLYDVSAGSLVRVSRGAADSGGSGARILVVPN